MSFYLGDDETDGTRSLPGDLAFGIVVAARRRCTRARYALRTVREVGTFLQRLAEALEQRRVDDREAFAKGGERRELRAGHES